MNPARILLLLLVLAAGCRKKDDLSNTNYSVRNKLPTSLNVRFYPSFADKIADRNRITATYLAPGQTWEVPLSTFAPNQSIYWDWFSDDYTLTNWEPRDSGLAFRYSLDGNSFSAVTGNTIEGYQPVMVRKVLLKGNAAETKWNAVQINNQPVPAGDHYALTFRHGGDYVLDNNGSLLNGLFDYNDSGPAGFPATLSIYLYVSPQSGSTVGTLYQRSFSSGTVYPTYGSDTLLAYLNTISGEVRFVREP